jgi:hypothetical protein
VGDAVGTSLLSLEWFIAPGRWGSPSSRFVALVGRHVPEVRPTRYGAFEPPPELYDPRQPQAFVAHLQDHPATDWYGRIPAVGGSATRPSLIDDDQSGKPAGSLRVDVDVC